MHVRMTDRLEDLREEVEQEVEALRLPKDPLRRVRATLAERAECHGRKSCARSSNQVSPTDRAGPAE
jgi:hypothetical protein